MGVATAANEAAAIKAAIEEHEMTALWKQSRLSARPED
jgi:hypothetical protein